MTIRSYRTFFIEQLAPVYDAMEAENIFHLALAHFHDLRRVDIALNPEIAFSDEDIKKYNSVLEKLKLEIPIQYILGKTSFCGLEFDVNENVLIPRPETEELVEWIFRDNEFSESKKLIDIGTGSGCIAISLAKKLPHFNVAAIDVSDRALATARQNAANNQASVAFIQSDVLSLEKLNQKYDIIVSNPPYVRELEKAEIKKNVLQYEPHLALFVADDDALLFYRKIAELALESLAQSGQLYFEINQYLGKETCEMLRSKGFSNIELRKDIYGNDRMVKASFV